MRLLSLFTFIICSLLSFSQYNNPYRLTWDGTNYLVTNKGNGTVTKIDSSFATSTVITGLDSPNDIFFGTFAGNSAIAIIDSNNVKLFDPGTYGSFINVPITGAVEAHDGVFNPNNTNEFFVSDRAGNKIIKGSIGSAPFYPVTYSTLVSNISKPAGMIFNSSGHLLVVCDTIDSEIHRIDITTGADSVWYSTSLDELNDIAQDDEGNYYVTCWGDNYLYRLDSNMTNEQRMIAFNNPAGMFVNSTYDYLALCCFLCNKVEFKSFHLYSPLNDLSSCENDSFIVDFNPVYWGIGTYNTDNQFIVELSDSNGVYGAPIRMRTFDSDTIPNYLECALPEGDYAVSGHRYRVRSTSPMTTSYFDKALNLKLKPDAYTYSSDTVSLCIGSNILLGQAAVSGHIYDWTPGTTLSDSTIAKPLFNAQPIGNYPLHLSETGTNGCSNSNDLLVIVGPKLSIPQLQDTLAMCPGDSIQVGADGLPFYFSWSGSDSMSDKGIGNPIYYDIQSSALQVIFSDSTFTCSGTDSVYVVVHETPGFGAYSETVVDSSCAGAQWNLSVDLDTSINYLWSTNGVLIDSSATAPVFRFDSVSLYWVRAQLTSTVTGCSGEDQFEVQGLALPTLFPSQPYAEQVCAETETALKYQADTSYLYFWESTASTLVKSGGSNQPSFIANGTVSLDNIPVSFIDQNTGCENAEVLNLETVYDPSSLDLENRNLSGDHYITLADDLLTAELSGADSTAALLWYLNGQMVSSSLSTKGRFNRDDFSHGDTLKAHIYRIVNGDTLCDYWTTEYIKTNLGSIPTFNSSLIVYPNPVEASKGVLHFQSDTPIEDVRMYTVDGRLIESRFTANQLHFQAESGYYLLKVKSNSNWFNTSVLVQ